MSTINLSQTFQKAETMPIDDFSAWCETLKPDTLLRLELHLRRIHEDDKAAIVQVTGMYNCGEEYDTVMEYA